MKTNLLLTCEHGGHKIPPFIQKKIKIPQQILESHRGWDIGALAIAKKLQKEFAAPLFYQDISRLVIDYNRSLHHPKIWSEFSKILSTEDKQKLIFDYNSYREKLIPIIKKPTLHLAIHSFTPIMGGIERNCEISLLFDPKNKTEKIFATEVKFHLKSQGIRCRLNYPYLGIADGLATALRKKFKSGYAGIEIEFNQSIVHEKKYYRCFVNACKEILKS